MWAPAAHLPCMKHSACMLASLCVVCDTKLHHCNTRNYNTGCFGSGLLHSRHSGLIPHAHPAILHCIGRHTPCGIVPLVLTFVQLMPGCSIVCKRMQSISRQCVRAVKEMDSKSIGLCPQGFESPRCRYASQCPMRLCTSCVCARTHMPPLTIPFNSGWMRHTV